MELKSLLIGLTFTIGIFALKSGVGLHYFLSRERELKFKLLFFFIYSIVYFFIFMLSSLILQKMNIIRHFEAIQTFLKSGMFVHMIVACFLLIWGVILVKRQKNEKRITHAWLLMIIPCPVCIMIIFFSAGFLFAFFPDFGNLAVLCAYAVFIVINIATMVVMSFWKVLSDSTPESILGSTMLMIAVYFLLSVIIMPQFSDLDKIYRLAAYKGEINIINTDQIILYLLVIISSILFGFYLMKRKIRRN
jgi:predicted transporter